MLDTYGRKYVSPLIGMWVNLFDRMGWSPTQVTILAFVIGVASMVAYYFGALVLAVCMLWLSGLFDAVDGALARKNKHTSKWGTLLDITFDRLVEIGMLIIIATKHPYAMYSILFVLGSIIFSMTVFLTVGALSTNDGTKSFRYQAGLAERTEGFLLITVMMIFTSHVDTIGYLFTGLIVFTALQRLIEAKRVLDS